MKTYDFRIVIRRAEFTDYDGAEIVSIPYGASADVYTEQCIAGTLKDALSKRAELSAAERRPHAAFLTMKYRDERSPPGFKSASKALYRRA